MLYPLSYSRAAGSVSSARTGPAKPAPARGWRKTLKLHIF